MNKLKIYLSTPEQLAEFVDICSKYECNITVYDERIKYDAKRISINYGKVIEVQAITSDEGVILSFIEDMRKFKV